MNTGSSTKFSKSIWQKRKSAPDGNFLVLQALQATDVPWKGNASLKVMYSSPTTIHYWMYWGMRNKSLPIIILDMTLFGCHFSVPPTAQYHKTHWKLARQSTRQERFSCFARNCLLIYLFCNWNKAFKAATGQRSFLLEVCFLYISFVFVTRN